MITEKLIQWWFEFIGFVISGFPTLDLPEWVTDINDYATQGVLTANGLHNWVPLDALRNSFMFLLTVGAAVLAVRVVRILISHFTGGGGAAA